MDHFGLTKQFYSLDYNHIHFVAMSTEVSFIQMIIKYWTNLQ